MSTGNRGTHEPSGRLLPASPHGDGVLDHGLEIGRLRAVMLDRVEPRDPAVARLELRREAGQRAIEELADVPAEVAERERGRAAVAVELVADEAERRQLAA